MHVILLALGLVAVVAGLGLVAVNMPIDMARLGNTLVIVGMIATAGGLIVAGLATANRQLRRIAQALDVHPQLRTGESAGLAAPLAAAAPAPAPQELLPLLDTGEPRGDEVSRAVEPKMTAVGPAGSPAAAAADVPAAPEPVAHPIVLDPPVVEAPAPRAEPAPPADKSAFDAVWSSGTRNAHVEPRAHDDSAASLSPGATTVPLETHSDKSAPPAPVAHENGGAVTVFKSGVIDGMAYTLYTDGSIEAELAQGLVHFASVDELRTYLDQHA